MRISGSGFPSRPVQRLHGMQLSGFGTSGLAPGLYSQHKVPGVEGVPWSLGTSLHPSPLLTSRGVPMLRCDRVNGLRKSL